MKLFLETVSPKMIALLTQLMEIEELNPFRLVGGTALALQFGHRMSVDIDLFAGGRAETQGLPKVINQHFGNSFQLVSQNRNGFAAQINDIKVDIVDWKVPFTEEPLIENGIRMATAPDIFASKCDALMDRKAEKDFVDIAMIASHENLSTLFLTLKARYPYLSTGAISAFLLKKDLIERDNTIRYLHQYNFEYFATIIQNKIIGLEKALKEKKESETDARDEKIRALIEQKRKNK
jgi:hypothetical protein